MKAKHDSPTIRLGNIREKAELEAIQMRASLVWPEDRAMILANPECIAIPICQIESGHVIVAVHKDRLVGFAAAEFLEDSTAELDGLFIEPAHWGKGFGQSLVEAIEILARKKGSHRLTLVANAHAEGFYLNSGFTTIGETTTQFGSALALHKAII